MRVSLAAALALATAGCVMPDQLGQIQKDVADVRSELRQIQDEQARTRSSLAEIEALAARQDEVLSREELADLMLRLEELARQGAVSDERLEDFGRRLDDLNRDVQRNHELIQRVQRTSGPRSGGAALPLPGETGEPPAPPRDADDVADAIPTPTRMPPAEATPDPEALYNSAYADFSKGNFALAISGFEEYHELFPDSPQADNALYWVGECHFSQGDFAEALRAYDKLLAAYPTSDRAAASNLKKALAFLEQNQVGQAIVQLRFVISSYPGSDEARIARDKLTSLGADA
jgi:tol-pal system protein YbgF